MSTQVMIAAADYPFLLDIHKAGSPLTLPKEVPNFQLVISPYPSINGEVPTESQLWTFEPATTEQMTAANVDLIVGGPNSPPLGSTFFLIKNVADSNSMIGIKEGQTSSGTAVTFFSQIPSNPAGLLWYVVPSTNTGQQYIGPGADSISKFWIMSSVGNLAISIVHGEPTTGMSLCVLPQQNDVSTQINSTQLWQILQEYNTAFEPKIAINGYGIQDNVLWLLLVGTGFSPCATVYVTVTLWAANGSFGESDNIYSADPRGGLAISMPDLGNLQSSTGIAGAKFQFAMSNSPDYSTASQRASLTTFMAANGTFYGSSGGTVSEVT